jgi:hypothetical protein
VCVMLASQAQQVHSRRRGHSLEKRRHIHDPTDGLPEYGWPFHLETDEAPKHLCVNPDLPPRTSEHLAQPHTTSERVKKYSNGQTAPASRR